MVSKDKMLRLVAPALLLLSAGCFQFGDSDNNSNSDAGTQPDPACEGVNTDAGNTIVECFPVNGTGCDIMQDNLACVWNPDIDKGECRCSSNRNPLGGACSEQRQDCVAGSACLFLSIDNQPTCHKVCQVGAQLGCEMLATAEEAFACLPLQGPQGITEEFGLCLSVGLPCDPLADTCPAGNSCGLVGRATSCGPEGSAGVGEQCQNNGCAKGGLCVVLTERDGTPLPATCYAACEPSNPECATGACSDVGLTYGLCL